VNQFFKKD